MFNEAVIIENIIAFCKEMEAMLKAGKNLREISRWTYEQRESGRDIPYMSIAQTVKGSNEVIGLWAKPTTKQKALKQFFDIVAPELHVLNKYCLRLYKDDEGLRFEERLGKGKNNVKILYQYVLAQA